MSAPLSIEFAGTDEELHRYLSRCARTFGGGMTRDASNGTCRLSFGFWLSLNPNTIRWDARVRREGNSLLLETHAVTLPWTRAKVDRILAFRQAQVADYLEVALRGGAVEKFSEASALRPFAVGGTGVAAATAAFGWLMMSALACGVLAWGATLLAGLILGDLQLAEIGGRAVLFRRLGLPACPSPAELASVDFGFRLGIAALFAFPTAFFSGTLLTGAHLAGEAGSFSGRFPLAAFVFLALIHALAFFTTLPIYASLPCAVLIPLAAHAGYSIVWSRRKERRRDLVEAPRTRGVRVAGILLGAALVAMIVPWPRSGAAVTAGLAEFRDRFLFGHPAGKAVVGMYYRYTLYAAEPLKEFYGVESEGHPPYVRQLRTARLVGDAPQVRDHLRRMGFAVVEGEGGVGSFDLVVALEGLPAPAGSVRVTPFVSPEELRGVAAAAARTAFKAGALRELHKIGWLSVFYAGPLVGVLLLALPVCVLVSLLYRKLPPRLALLGVAVLFFAPAVALISIAQGKEGTLEAVKAIREIGPSTPGGAENLLPHLNHSEVAVRYEALRRLYEVLKVQRPPGAFDALVRAASDEDLRVRLWACGALGNLGDGRAVPVLVPRLSDPELYVRYRAAEALGRLKSAEAAAPLLEMVQSRCWYEGMYALHALRRIDPVRF